MLAMERSRRDSRLGCQTDRARFPVTIAVGPHPFPSRTRKLRPPAPMVLGGQPPGRVGRRRDSRCKDPCHGGGTGLLRVGRRKLGARICWLGDGRKTTSAGGRHAPEPRGRPKGGDRPQRREGAPGAGGKPRTAKPTRHGSGSGTGSHRSSASGGWEDRGPSRRPWSSGNSGGARFPTRQGRPPGSSDGSGRAGASRARNDARTGPVDGGGRDVSRRGGFSGTADPKPRSYGRPQRGPAFSPGGDAGSSRSPRRAPGSGAGGWGGRPRASTGSPYPDRAPRQGFPRPGGATTPTRPSPQAVATLASLIVGLVKPARSGADRVPPRTAVDAHPVSPSDRSTAALVAREDGLHQARTGVNLGHTSRVTPSPRRGRATAGGPATGGPARGGPATGGPATGGPAIEVRSPDAGGLATTAADIEVRRPLERPGEIRSEEQQVVRGAGRASIEPTGRAARAGVVLLVAVTTGEGAAMRISDALGHETGHPSHLNGPAHAEYQTEKCRPGGVA